MDRWKKAPPRCSYPPDLSGGHYVSGDWLGGLECEEPGCGFHSFAKEEARRHRLETGARPAREQPPDHGWEAKKMVHELLHTR